MPPRLADRLRDPLVLKHGPTLALLEEAAAALDRTEALEQAAPARLKLQGALDALGSQYAGWLGGQIAMLLSEQDIRALLALAAEPLPTAGWQEEHDRLLKAVETVLKTFRNDEAQGFRSKDRQFAISILSFALPSDPPSEKDQ